MAIYHLRVKYVKRADGRSSVAAAAYRSGTRLTDERNGGIVHDYSRKRDIEHTEILLPEHMPETYRDRGVLWNTIETGIKHPRGQPAFEVEVALPRELSPEQCVRLVREFTYDQFVRNGLPADIAIHRTIASDSGEHPHAHILLSTRRFNDDGSIGKTARDMQDSPKLVAKVYALEDEGKIDEAVVLQNELWLGQWRQAWEDYSNRFLEDAGSEARIDHRTLEAQAIGREATPNVGVGFYGRLRAFQGYMEERLHHWKEVSFRNAMREQMDRIMEHRPDLNAEFIAHAREYARNLFPELQQEGPDREQEIER